ncbi:PREDICTED: uncharacterized protein LOC105120118 isoform X1 [Populus euphratica]|uniref:Uncharacterized protein LOC105120118 isoform X1 n=1 Tax=Populus euphratica TaxID=75702 RepID=A0AAJ6XFE2_POPEU|nr:PREDICTED: uncharacterized protein LOC105120118 isoform X1 [Populus euphratica]
MEYRIDNYLLKGNVLSSLGEVAFRRGESNPQRYYFEASSIFDTWLGEYSKPGADMYPFPVWCIISLTITLCVTISIYLKCPACVLIDHILASESRYVKLLICLEGSDDSKAHAQGCKAYLIYDALHKKLLSEIDSVTRTANQRRGSSSVRRTDPFIQLKKDAANQMHDIITELAIKIQQKGSFLSLVREITSGSPAGRTDAQEEQSKLTQILNSEEHIDD